jgi:cytohesin
VADINTKDENGQTALHTAASVWKGKAMVQLLVDRVADVKARNNNGNTVLHLAVRAGNKAVVQLLKASLTS